MITVFVCDDSNAMIEKYSGLIAQIAQKHGIDAGIVPFHSGEALIGHLSDSPIWPDIIYLDILMDVLNGFETAKRLRGIGCTAEIIFLTSSGDYVYDAFDVSPVQYLIKNNIDEAKFEQVFFRAVALTENKKTRMFACASGSAKKVIPLKDISYFEILKRVVIVHFGAGETFEFYMTMDELEKQMLDKGFLRVHRSYIVNMPRVSKFSTQGIQLKNGESIPIGVTYMDNVKRVFLDYLQHNYS